MTDPITTDSALVEDILRTTRESIDNLVKSIHGEFKSGPIVHREVEIAASTLKAILVLLEFHPRENARQAYIEIVQLILEGKQIYLTPQELIAKKSLHVSANPRPTNEVLDEVLDIILEYGKSVDERKKKKAEQAKDADDKTEKQ
jgi:hypothetical protein